MKKQSGSYTLEAVIVMSTIIFIIFAILFAFLLIYQNAVMYYVASRAAQEGAVMWSDPSHSMSGNREGDAKPDYYYRIGELFAMGKSITVRQGDAERTANGVEGKEYQIAFWALKTMKRLIPPSVVGSGAETVTVTFHNYVLYKEIEISIEKEVNIPFREIARYFPNDLDMNVTVKASIYGPAEYIRNVDYALELGGELWGKVKDKLDKLLKNE